MSGLKQAHGAHRRALLAGDDEVVDHGEVDRFPGEREPAGDLAVGNARGGIAARVIMRQDYSRAAVQGGIGDHLAKRKGGTAIVAVVPRKVDAAGAVIDMGDPQMFAGRVGFGEAVGEEAAGRFEAVEQQRGFGTLMEHGGGVRQSTAPGDGNRIRFGATLYPLWRSIAPLPRPARRLG